VAEQARQDRAGGTLGLGVLEGAPHLAEHLGLAQHARTQTGGDLEQMGGDAVVEQDGPLLVE
jgi:hypothetical protein